MKYLVTGGAGFIGSAFVRNIILNTKDNVLNYDNLSYSSNLNSLKKVSSSTRYNFVRGDINDRNNLLSVLNDYQPDFIINFAAETHVDRSISDPKNFIDTNIFFTFNLIVCANEYWQKLPKNKKSILDFTKFQLMKFVKFIFRRLFLGK